MTDKTKETEEKQPYPESIERQLQLASAVVAALKDVQSKDPELVEADSDTIPATVFCRYSDGMEYMVQVRPLLDEPVLFGLDPRKEGINPISFWPTNDGCVLTIGRMHIQRGESGEVRRIMPVAVSEPREKRPLAHMTIDEDRFVDGMRHLFPHGELSAGAESVVRQLVDWWEGFDDLDMEGNEFLHAVEPIVAAAQRVLRGPDDD